MTAKTRVKIILCVLLLTAALFGGFMFYLFQKNQQALDKAQIASQIQLKVFERKFLGDEYAFMRSERAKSQWFVKQKDVKKLVAAHEADFHTPKERELMTQLKESLMSSEDVFQDVVALHEAQPPGSDDTFTEEKTTRLSSQLAIKAQETIAAAARLKDINDKNEKETFRQIIMLFSVTGGVFLMVLLGSSLEIWRVATQLERKKAEREAILRDIGDAVFAIDANRKIVLFNKIASKLSGFTEEEVMGKPYQDILKFVDEKTKQPKDEFIETALTGKRTHMDKSIEILTKTGRRIPVADSAAPLFNAEGIIQGVVVVFRDITPERQLERAKDEFLSVASHQLRTPIGSIRWNLELLLADKKLSKAVRKRLQETHASTTRALMLVGDLLNVARIEAGHVQDNPALTDLTEIIQMAAKEMQPIVRAQKITMKVDVKKAGPPVVIDAKRFREVVQNLMSNAVKYTRPGGAVTVTIDGSKSKETLISIADTGIGIPDKEQRNIFSKFFRAENAITTQAEGSGLGLFVVKSYVEGWGGRVRFSSRMGKGTTFYMSVPHEPKAQSSHAKDGGVQ